MPGPGGQVEAIQYVGGGATTYGTISLTGPSFRTGTAFCGVETTGGKPVDLDAPACSFLKRGIAYDDPAVQCTMGACPVPANP
jgi:hypothetical protein